MAKTSQNQKLTTKDDNLLTEIWPIENVKPYAKNPRNNADAVEGVAKSIKRFGWQNPIRVDKEGVIVCGHTRYQAALSLKLKEVPVMVTTNLTEKQIKEYRIADNKLSEAADWQKALLRLEFLEIGAMPGEDPEDIFTGFTDEEIDKILDSNQMNAIFNGDQDEEFDPAEMQIYPIEIAAGPADFRAFQQVKKLIDMEKKKDIDIVRYLVNMVLESE